MQRDMDLVRELLLRLETVELPIGASAVIDFHDPELSFTGKSPDEVKYHFALLKQVGLVLPFDRRDLFQSLSWDGHDFADSVRDPEVWAKAKQGALEAKGFTFDLLRDLVKGLIKKKMEDWTGIPL